MVFAEGSRRPDDEELDILSVNDLQAQYSSSLPKVYAFYYTADGEDTNIETTLDVITHPKARRTVVSYTAFPPLPVSTRQAVLSWRFISVALALESPPPDVIRHPAL